MDELKHEHEVVLKVDHLYKKFTLSLKRSLLYGSIDLFRNILGRGYYEGGLRKAEFWALQDISFELHKGEVLGIIGENGSGKSTLLRLLNGIFPPDRGTITVKGRMGALIAVGAGFHPNMTGKENIYLNGTILGMSQEEIKEKFQEIVDFADIGEFLDAPVSTYSSGMRVRLGFSIAIHSRPEILLIDEILSVGDLAFRNKSLRKIYEMRKEAKGIIFISHNIEQILNLCDRVIVLHKGKKVFEGDAKSAVLKYYEVINERAYDQQHQQMITGGKFRTTESAEINEVSVTDSFGNKDKGLVSGSTITLALEFTIKVPIEKPRFIAVIREDNIEKDIVWMDSRDVNEIPTDLEPGHYSVNIQIPDLNISPGNYSIGFSVGNAISGEMFMQIQKLLVINFKVNDAIPRGIIPANTTWELTKDQH